MASDDRGLWIKLYQNLIDDPVFMRMTDTAKAVYHELYCLAGKSDANGLILAGGKVASLDDIAFLLRRPDDLLKVGISELEANELISLDDNQVIVTRYSDEQVSREERREQWRIRQERHREKEKESNKEKEKELKIDKESESESDSHTDVTSESRVTNADDEESQKLLKIISTQTAIKPLNAETIGDLKELMRAKGLTPDDLLAGIQDLKVNPKAKAPAFTTIGGLVNWSDGYKVEKVKALDPNSYEGKRARKEQGMTPLELLEGAYIDADQYEQRTGQPAPVEILAKLAEQDNQDPF